MPAVFQDIHKALEAKDPAEKCRSVSSIAGRKEQSFADRHKPLCPIGEPGRPDRPLLVEPASLPRRRLGSQAGRAALIHAVAHIEFNAINLALDAAYRFRDMPESFTLDWISVAADEARHFQLLDARLRELGHRYGDFPAHDGLWEMARRTSDSCLARMALVPRVLEARGLDVTPAMIKKLQNAGDHSTVRALEVILAEEVRHVAIGTHWFRYCCSMEALDPQTAFIGLLRRHFGWPKGPFNTDARLQAGFTPDEMALLEGGAL